MSFSLGMFPHILFYEYPFKNCHDKKQLWLSPITVFDSAVSLSTYFFKTKKSLKSFQSKNCLLNWRKKTFTNYLTQRCHLPGNVWHCGVNDTTELFSTHGYLRENQTIGENNNVEPRIMVRIMKKGLKKSRDTIPLRIF